MSMKWVKHPRWGWLPDDAPLFEACFRVAPGEFDDGDSWEELREAGEVSNGRIALYAENGIALGLGPVGLLRRDGEASPHYEPLTTAARELLAALRAEVQP